MVSYLFVPKERSFLPPSGSREHEEIPSQFVKKKVYGNDFSAPQQHNGNDSIG